MSNSKSAHDPTLKPVRLLLAGVGLYLIGAGCWAVGLHNSNNGFPPIAAFGTGLATVAFIASMSAAIWIYRVTPQRKQPQ